MKSLAIIPASFTRKGWLLTSCLALGILTGHAQKGTELQFKKTEKLLSELGIFLDVSSKAIEFVAIKAYDPNYGARPIRRYIQREVENIISNGIITGDYKESDVVVVDVDKEKLKMSVKTHVQTGR